ncbi:hypothetical protein E2C01_072822 [Portunus trituberculatus]|uniref:Uncharacterized protein n=1 Tax=Portunus trituberculatus TaxID=210409 RepID=A0A5B7IBQ0_PORTR|nr:hypothetical protein [Portunus trituberculatus]
MRSLFPDLCCCFADTRVEKCEKDCARYPGSQGSQEGKFTVNEDSTLTGFIHFMLCFTSKGKLKYLCKFYLVSL